MRTLVFILGLLLLAAGCLFMAQGSGVVNWPSNSFMLGQQAWVTYGAIIGNYILDVTNG